MRSERLELSRRESLPPQDSVSTNSTMTAKPIVFYFTAMFISHTLQMFDAAARLMLEVLTADLAGLVTSD